MKFSEFWKKYVESEEVEKMGVSAAGPVPNSLLAAQDLEGKTKKQSIKIIKEEMIDRQKEQLEDRKSFKDVWLTKASTDSADAERSYQTLKQEKLLLVGNLSSLDSQIKTLESDIKSLGDKLRLLNTQRTKTQGDISDCDYDIRAVLNSLKP